MHDDQFTLRWYRDQGNGQKASDAVKAVEVMEGTWPVAILPCQDYADAGRKWEQLLKEHNINAMTYFPVVKSE